MSSDQPSLSRSSDTSSTARIIKNPLLSAVTGVTFDDYTQNALLLPAVIEPPPPTTVPLTIAGGNIQSSKSVIYDPEPAIIETDNQFSEINLNQPSNEPDLLPTNYYLSEDTPIYTRNPNQDPTYNPFGQAGSITQSLSQLPTVASSVLSSFSSILRGTSPIQSKDTQNPIEQNSNKIVTPPLSDYDNYSYQNTNIIESDVNRNLSAGPVVNEPQQQPPPVFYSPNEITFNTVNPTENTVRNNSYRLAAKKKIYAPIPGLSNQLINLQQPVPVEPTVIPPPVVSPESQFFDTKPTPITNPLVYQPQTIGYSSIEPESKPKFSLSSFFSSKLQLSNTEQKKVESQLDGTTPYPILAPDNAIDLSGFSSIDQPKQTNVEPTFFSQPEPNLSSAFIPPIQPANSVISGTTPYPILAPDNAIDLSGFSSIDQPKQTSVEPTFFSQPEPNLSSAFIPPIQPANSVISLQSPPQPIGPPPVPSSGQTSNSYRLRGKPHYRNPSQITSETQPHIVKQPINYPSPFPTYRTPTSEINIFNPTNQEEVVQPTLISPAHSDSHNNNPPLNFYNPLNVNPGLQQSSSSENRKPVTTDISNYFNPSGNDSPLVVSNTPVFPIKNDFIPPPIDFFTQTQQAEPSGNKTDIGSNILNYFTPSETYYPLKPEIQPHSASSADQISEETSSPIKNEINEYLTSDVTDENNEFEQNFFNNPPPLLIDQPTIPNISNPIILNNADLNTFGNVSMLSKPNEANLKILNVYSPEDTSSSIWSNLVEPPSSAQSELSIEGVEQIATTCVKTEFEGSGNIQLFQSNIGNIPIVTNQNIFRNMEDQKSPDTQDASTVSPTSTIIKYRPTYKHWFYKHVHDSKTAMWKPFTMVDSMNLEDKFLNINTEKKDNIVITDGGRYDVNIVERKRYPIYWNGEPNLVRRCSWFYKGLDARWIPYEEDMADLLEEEYRFASHSGDWHRKIELTNGEMVQFDGPNVMAHFLQSQSPDNWSNTSVSSQPNSRPRVVKRGIDEFNIEDGEPEQIDHLLFMVHGIGAACDFKFRSVEEVVDEFRGIALQLVQSHYRTSYDRCIVGRVEVLPVSWHSELHSEESGIDVKLKAITLESIPKLRTFTNETLLDILFYTSPVFCQQIIDTVGNSINRLYSKFCQRNPSYRGGTSLAGHSLGSLILFDLLQHQKPVQPYSEKDAQGTENSEKNDVVGDLVSPSGAHRPLARTSSQQINYHVVRAGTGQPFINYPQLAFQPKNFFALGSPIGMFVTIRGIDNLGVDFKLPTTEGFYNIFHPYDPVAYRIEALVNSVLATHRPILISHHKGRKRMHIELRETMARVGADIKRKIVDTIKNTMSTVYSFAQKSDPKALQQEVDKVIEEQLACNRLEERPRTSSICSTASSDVDSVSGGDIDCGKLNQGRRIDYVLQEAPLEFCNEYLFALTSHVCYWDSEDTTLFIMKEIYSSMGIQTDSKIPQQSMTIERPVAGSSGTEFNENC